MNSSGNTSSGGAYKPPRLRKSNQSRPKKYEPQRSQSNATSLISTDEELAKRKQRFSNDKAKRQQDYGLISRGEDNRLQRDPEARIEYFKKIQNDFTQSFADNDTDSLRDIFAGLSLKDKSIDDKRKEKVDQILLSLRKLREALLKFEPDDFAKSVFLFSIRVSTRIGHYQTYIPSILFLLRHEQILTKTELNEIACCYSLHLAHFNRDNLLALEIFFNYSKDDIWLHKVLKSWGSQDYRNWFELYFNESDSSKTRIMKYGEEKMISYTIQCLTKSYFQLPKVFVENLFHNSVETLIKRGDCTWILNENTVVIRSRTKTA